MAPRRWLRSLMAHCGLRSSRQTASKQLRITLHLHPAGVSRAELDSLALWEQMDGEAEEDLEPYSYGTEGAALAEEGTLLHMNSDELLLLALPPLLLLGAPLIIRGTCRAHT